MLYRNNLEEEEFILVHGSGGSVHGHLALHVWAEHHVGGTCGRGSFFTSWWIGERERERNREEGITGRGS
jgi:hypothetical protein